MALGGGTFINTNKKFPGSYINQKTKDIIAGLKAKIASLNNEMSDGKTLIAGAITEKGVATEPTDTFQTMADNILNIQTERTYPNGFFKMDSLTDITDSVLTVLPNDYGFTNIDMATRSWRIYDDLLDNGFNVHSFNETSETVDGTTVTYRTFRLSPPSVNDIGFLFSYNDSTLISVKRYTKYLSDFASSFSASATRFLIKRIKNSYCIITFRNDVIPVNYNGVVHFLSDAYDSNGVLFGCLFDSAILSTASFDFSEEGGTNNGVASIKAQTQIANSSSLFIQDLYAVGNNTGDLATPFYIDSLCCATVFPTPASHTETYIFKSDDDYEFLLLAVNGTNSNYRAIRIK